MKNPNGYGCIKLLSGSRRRPFVFMVSVNGKQKAMGYFATKLEAMAYQVDYNQSHGLHRLSKITFAELYARWMPKHISYASVSKSTINGYECAYKHCASLYDLPIADIKYSHLQAQLSLGSPATFAIMITGITNSTFTLYCDTPGEKTVHVIAICI